MSPLTGVGLVGLIFRHWLLVAACIVVGAMFSIGVAHFLVTPSYTASAKLYVSGQGATADERATNGEYARTHVSSYADMILSNDVLNGVRGEVGLAPSQDGTHRDLAGSISSENPLGTLIIDVTVQDSSPQRAQAVAAAIGPVTNSVVARLESSSGAVESPVQISVVSPPTVPTAKDSPSRKLYGLVGLFLGGALGVAGAWLKETWPRIGRESARSSLESQSWSWWLDDAPATALSEAQRPLALSSAEQPRRNGHAPNTAAGKDRGSVGA